MNDLNNTVSSEYCKGSKVVQKSNLSNYIGEYRDIHQMSQ